METFLMQDHFYSNAKKYKEDKKKNKANFDLATDS